MATLIALSVLITNPSSPLVAFVGATVDVVASIAHLGSDTLRCTFNFDGGGVNQVVVAAKRSCTASNTFTAAGVFTVVVTATNTGGGIDTDTAVVLVVDRQSQVSGRGTLGRRTHFNLDPAGFTFGAPGFDFESTTVDAVVVAGGRSQVRGSGTVNGSGSFGFILTVTDGKLAGGDGLDRLRLKVVDRLAGDALVYDNVPGAPDDIDIADPQAIPAGSILIHKEK